MIAWVLCLMLIHVKESGFDGGFGFQENTKTKKNISTLSHILFVKIENGLILGIIMRTVKSSKNVGLTASNEDTT